MDAVAGHERIVARAAVEDPVPAAGVQAVVPAAAVEFVPDHRVPGQPVIAAGPDHVRDARVDVVALARGAVVGDAVERDGHARLRGIGAGIADRALRARRDGGKWRHRVRAWAADHRVVAPAEEVVAAGPRLEADKRPGAPAAAQGVRPVPALDDDRVLARPRRDAMAVAGRGSKRDRVVAVAERDAPRGGVVLTRRAVAG